MSYAKDALLGWALRELRKETAIACHDGLTRYPSRTLEFAAAAERLVPDIEEFAAMSQEHADLLVCDMLKGEG